MFLFRHCFIVMKIFYKLEVMKMLFKASIFIFVASGLYTFSSILKSMIFLIENFLLVSGSTNSFVVSFAFLMCSVISQRCSSMAFVRKEIYFER